MKTRTLTTALAGIISFLATAVSAQVTVSTVAINGLNEPYGVAVDVLDNFYISDSANNRILRVDASTQVASTWAGIPGEAGSNDGPPYLAHFNNPQGLLTVSIGGVGGLLVADSGNNLIRFVRFSDGVVTTLAGQTAGGPAVNAAGSSATFRFPAGFDQDSSGNVCIADWGNNTIRVMNLNDPAFGITNLVISGTSFNRPTAVAFAGTNQLWVADTGNQMIKLITLATPTSGTLTTYVGGYRLTGTTDSSFGPNARFNGPSGLFWLSGVGLLISDTLNNSIRLATNNPAYGATNYAVVTWAGTSGNGGLQDGSAATAKFNSPVGLAQDIIYNGFLVADLKNNAIRRIQTGPPPTPVPAPAIGWVDFTVPPAEVVSVLRTNSPFVFNNDVVIAIAGPAGAETYFTFGSPASSVAEPNAITGGTPPGYHDGMLPNEVPFSIVPPQPDVTVKAIGVAPGRPSSAVVSARFQFKTANPVVTGNNAASFNVTDQTVGAQMWYTLDGTDPTNAAPSLGPITSVANLSLNVSSNLTFKVRAFRPNYQNSGIVTTFFSTTNFVPNSISFGFATGEASSDFIASPGQNFYAPVTLSPLAGTVIYSLQFNLTVTNAGINPGPPVLPGAYNFTSFLEKPIPGTTPVMYERIPPLMFSAYLLDPPPAGQIRMYDGLPFVNMIITNSTLNLLGVGWLERIGMTNLYDTKVQSLISFSQPHDTLFTPAMGTVVLGGYAFQVPAITAPGQTYQIQIGRPSATSDGIGAPGSDVYIATPTNGSLTVGAVNSIKIVTAGQRKYIVGDCAPFRWFNAGDFGNTNLNNSDVMQVFQSAIYGLNKPPDGSDFYDSMDSCGGFGGLDSSTGYYTNAGPLTLAQLNGLFDGNDTLIDSIAFGESPQRSLDVCDIYVTFRRSLDPSLTWYRRFWTNGVLEAEPLYPQPQPQAQAKTPLQAKLSISFQTNPPAINFAAADFTASAGQTLQIPITARIFGDYPLRVLMLNLSVEPLDGSPALTSPVQFKPNAALGDAAMSSSTGNGNYAATWLNSAIAGLTGTATLGTLTVTIPANAPSSAAYAIHFDHASASPNGIASFPKQTLTGLILLSDRSSSSYSDNIPDSWRLRYFGTVNNILSQASADADGDGASNQQEYLAGTDPTDPNSVLRVSTGQAVAQPGQDCVIHWPSVAGKRYIIERSTSLFGPNWIPVSTNTGSGTDMELHDTSGGTVRFYRVHVAP
jgi:hypothetical protein